MIGGFCAAVFLYITMNQNDKTKTNQLFALMLRIKKIEILNNYNFLKRTAAEFNRRILKGGVASSSESDSICPSIKYD